MSNLNPTINHNNKHIIEEQFSVLTKNEFNEFMHDDEKNPKTTLGHVFKMIDKDSKQVFFQIARNERDKRKHVYKVIKEDINLGIDTTTALLEAVKNSNINTVSFFTKSKMLDDISEIIDIPRNKIEKYLNQDTVINENIIYENLLYTQIQEALKIIRPVHAPQIKMDMNESTIWEEVRNNEDQLLENKIKIYLSAKKNEYKKLSRAEKSIKKETFSDPIHELNKLQKGISKVTRSLNHNELEELALMMDEGLNKFKSLKEQFDIDVPKDDSVLSKFIRTDAIKKSEQVSTLFEKAQKYLEKLSNGTNKKIVYKSFFDYKSIIENDKEASAIKNVPPQLDWIGEYSIILKETDNEFLFNIVTKPFIQEKAQEPESVDKQLEENYNADLIKSKKTLARKYKGKKFKAIPDIDDTESVTHIDTNGWRIHLYQDPKTEDNIDYNLEYYPSNYRKTDLTETEKFYQTIKESMNAKKLEAHLLNGEHIMIPDTGVVLWYSASDKQWMIDLKPVSFKELYNLYKQENKRHHGELK